MSVISCQQISCKKKKKKKKKQISELHFTKRLGLGQSFFFFFFLFSGLQIFSFFLKSLHMEEGIKIKIKSLQLLSQ